MKGNNAITTGRIWKCCRNKPDGDVMMDFEWFKFKSRFKNKTDNAGIVNLEMAVPLNVPFLENIWNIALLINCEITLDITWTANCVIWKADKETAYCNKWHKNLSSSSNSINLR